MYRKLHILALAALAIAVSCNREETAADVTVRLNATIDPEMTVLVKGAGEAQPEAVNANHAVLQAWREGEMAAQAEQSIEPGTTQISFGGIKLAAGAEYIIYIWVDCEDYYDTEDLRSVSVKSDYNGLDPNFDAFFSCDTVVCGQNDGVHSVVLKRPFAKLCFSAEAASRLNVKYSAPTTLDLQTGKVSGVRSVEYTVYPAAASVAAFDYIFADEGIEYMNYTFALGDEAEKTTSVPVERNKKTNIIYTVTD